MTGRLAGKRALIAGAGGLLGSDLARAFAAEGAHLVLTTRTAAKLAPLADELGSRGARVETLAADFTCNADIDRLADSAVAAFGGLDVVLLSSQPATPGIGDLLSTPDEAWEDQQRAVAWGPFRLLRKLAPGMIAQGGASVITVVSSTGIDPIPGYGAYGLAKGALWLFTRYMAAEWGQYNIRVNALCPGLICTTGNIEAHEAMVRQQGMLSRTALNRVGCNSEVTGAAIWLASDESSFTTGQRINVDGGRY